MAEANQQEPNPEEGADRYIELFGEVEEILRGVEEPKVPDSPPVQEATQILSEHYYKNEVATLNKKINDLFSKILYLLTAQQAAGVQLDDDQLLRTAIQLKETINDLNKQNKDRVPVEYYHRIIKMLEEVLENYGYLGKESSTDTHADK